MFGGLLVAVSLVGTAVAPAVHAATAKTTAAGTPAPAKPAQSTPLLPGAGSKEPISIDAGKLDYFDKEQKLVYTGDVVAVQGESTLKASVLTIFLQKDPQAAGAAAPAVPAGTAPAGAAAGMGPGAGSSVSHMEADGPVTLISKDQVGTGDHATYDKAENKVYLKGNVTLSQGTNVTQGDRLVYDMTSGQAQVFSGQTGSGRVKSVFTPGSAAPGEQADQAAPKAGKAAKRKPVKAGKAAAQGEDAAAQQ